MKSLLQILIVISGILFITTSCARDDDGYWISYYKTVGEGYIFDGTNNMPLKNATITVRTAFKGSTGGWLGTPIYSETFTTDKNGYYQINFLKREHNDKAVKYTFEVSVTNCFAPPPPYWNRTFGISFPDITLYTKDLKGKNIITFDTVKYYEEIEKIFY